MSIFNIKGSRVIVNNHIYMMVYDFPGINDTYAGCDLCFLKKFCHSGNDINNSCVSYTSKYGVSSSERVYYLKACRVGRIYRFKRVDDE